MALHDEQTETRAQALVVRPAEESDVPALCDLLNEIIGIGGTTANEVPFTHGTFRDHFLGGADHISCLMVEDAAGSAAGFQILVRNSKLPDGWVDVATFARVHPKTRGAGTALFAKTVPLARGLGFAAINATIRADNTGGLAYYDKMGFRTYSVEPGVPLNDGTPVDRVSKKYTVG
ncbi:GNAT family N-acetyltransferase [Pelagibius litoralis]|uniref:GNAT family N-acetyltransferase n=1 Tax=Pelagibius litoralis TaxID=374515 RepID=A0A967EYP3_9PROT|nr:GNAT family N-acetyltransferase [Pelagibius litoralis]NIA69844.1 GNAT family N-acetyltransferase [Pelagibius litoralis]